nr:MbtH family NRPS accessory protein [Streptomyces sp. TSRI0281]
MACPSESDSGHFPVLVNEEDQHFLRPMEFDIPDGWNAAFGPGLRVACLDCVRHARTGMADWPARHDGHGTAPAAACSGGAATAPGPSVIAHTGKPLSLTRSCPWSPARSTSSPAFCGRRPGTPSAPPWSHRRSR